MLIWNQTEIRKETELSFNVLQDLAKLNTQLAGIPVQNDKIIVFFSIKDGSWCRELSHFTCYSLAKKKLSVLSLFMKLFNDTEFPESVLPGMSMVWN